MMPRKQKDNLKQYKKLQHLNFIATFFFENADKFYHCKKDCII